MFINEIAILTPEENRTYWELVLRGNDYYANKWSVLRNKMRNKNFRQWEEKNSEYTKS